MKFIQRLGYYLGGFSIGIIILLFFLNGKDASCDYGPNARTVKNIASKEIIYANEVATVINDKKLDSTIVKQLIRYGDVDFSESDTNSKPCKTYVIENSYKKREVIMKVKNCDSIAEVLTLEFTGE